MKPKRHKLITKRTMRKVDRKIKAHLTYWSYHATDPVMKAHYIETLKLLGA